MSTWEIVLGASLFIIPIVGLYLFIRSRNRCPSKGCTAMVYAILILTTVYGLSRVLEKEGVIGPPVTDAIALVVPWSVFFAAVALWSQKPSKNRQNA
ncbi:hypothetical protein E3E23_06365 [Thermococcus sp. CX2]|uniref:hypothetical protein n=1 Tax=Thermococcus sp. CX2 TaxID=163006 RepID=UPI00143BA8B6|nr:hypothetical protein [Thermococcus sp. CX2]NJE85446.1 hypothetical protein [Thermococcus sp. CX2]